MVRRTASGSRRPASSRWRWAGLAAGLWLARLPTWPAALTRHHGALFIWLAGQPGRSRCGRCGAGAAHLLHRHIAVPLGIAGAGLRSALPGDGRLGSRADAGRARPAAVLAAFALPTLQRSASAAIDWFSVFFFSRLRAGDLGSIAMQTGVPGTGGQRGAPGAGVPPELLGLRVAIWRAAGTLAYRWLVRWRTGRHPPSVWKSLVLPAGGVACAGCC